MTGQQLLSRFWKRWVPTTCVFGIAALLMSTSASAGMSGPGCLANNVQGSSTTNELDTVPYSQSCSTIVQQGYYGGPYANFKFDVGVEGYPSVDQCTSVSSQVTYGYAGNLYSGSRNYQSTIGYWSSSTGPSYGGLFGGRYWTTVAGIGEEYHVDVFVSGFNC